MTVFKKIAASLDAALELVLGEGLECSAEHLLKEYPSDYIYYILTSRS